MKETIRRIRRRHLTFPHPQVADAIILFVDACVHAENYREGNFRIKASRSENRNSRSIQEILQQPVQFMHECGRIFHLAAFAEQRLIEQDFCQILEAFLI